LQQLPAGAVDVNHRGEVVDVTGHLGGYGRMNEKRNTTDDQVWFFVAVAIGAAIMVGIVLFLSSR
jgi:hypothetical protein